MTKSRKINLPRACWTAELDAKLRSLYADNTTEVVAELIGARTSQVYSRAHALGLKKSAEFLASVLSGRVQRGLQHPSMIATRFKPGSAPWSKGTKGIIGVQEGCRATQFKPGRAAQDSRNYLPIGSVRITKDGYLERKVTDNPALAPARRWTAVHRLVWEAAHGPIPAGHVVAFRKGQFTTDADLLTVDRLECISRKENAHRNSIWRKDPEIAKLYQLKGAITRQVNRIKDTQHAKPTH